MYGYVESSILPALFGGLGTIVGVLLAFILQRHAASSDEEKKEEQNWKLSIERQVVSLGEKLDSQREQLITYTSILRYLHPELREFLDNGIVSRKKDQ